MFMFHSWNFFLWSLIPACKMYFVLVIKPNFDSFASDTCKQLSV